jgi:hypothetical protein
MAQSQLLTPDAAGKRTPRADILQINERLSNVSSDEESSDYQYHSPNLGNKENKTPSRGNKNSPKQGNKNSPIQGNKMQAQGRNDDSQSEPTSDDARDWRKERIHERVNHDKRGKTESRKRKRKHDETESSDSESSSWSENTGTESDETNSDTDMFNPSKVLRNKGGEKIPVKYPNTLRNMQTVVFPRIRDKKSLKTVVPQIQRN